ncbi:FAD-dependent oxidoreductase, partial [Oleiphilus sp. HI0080]
MASSFQYDVLIIGSGAAGLTSALKLDSSLSVAVISKGQLTSGSTPWAQGGIAAVLDQQDNEELHIQDTLIAGGGLCHEDAVRQTVNGGRESIKWLKSMGVNFTKDSAAENPKHYHLTKEGGHSHRRVV